jgi:hypothetical protein
LDKNVKLMFEELIYPICQNIWEGGGRKERRNKKGGGKDNLT